MQEKIKELIKLVEQLEQLEKLMIKIVSLTGWILILIKLFT